ncbi:hypothetical protein BDY19DRAFT_905249 [Irpex rosettiformis]|uniref:Uncharacterized protein n=1 Tax=Irpex rosettiformis TaxID=378272 RepID=A0ACB8U7S6_9APHY|nr:hypothetical protein BDY19DRAFT_905249 [Irpex rosettiformis]
MTVVIPSHISLPTLPTQHPDIAYNPAPSDPATPRAVLAHAAIDIVAAAVTIAPTLAPVLPTENSEYCLSSKRKTIEDDALDIPRISKRARSEDEPFFGSLADSPVPPDVDPVQATIIEQTLAAIFSYSSSPQDVDPQLVTADLPPSQPEPSLVPSSRIAHSPLAISITASHIESIEEATPAARPVSRLPSPPRNRAIEPPLWKVACRMRVDQVISMHGGHTIRASVAQEYRPPSPVAYSVSEPSMRRRSSPTIVDPSESELELEIMTPVTYPQSPDHSDKEETSISDAESDIDMSFDLDDDSDTDSDSEEDADIDILSAHESILDVPVSERDTVEDDDGDGDSAPESQVQPDATSFLPHPITLPLPIAMPPALPTWPPRLPRLSSIRAYCLLCDATATIRPHVSGTMNGLGVLSLVIPGDLFYPIVLGFAPVGGSGSLLPSTIHKGCSRTHISMSILDRLS